ncbi:superinfection immunity protein [Cellulomonas soli]
MSETWPAVQPTVLTDQRDPGGAVVALAWVSAVLTVAYMLPWAIAASRGRSNQGTIGILNLLLGWSLIGWIVTLVMACQAHTPLIGVPVAGYAAPALAAPAGWYPSPTGGQEYWDGVRWTGHRAP